MQAAKLAARPSFVAAAKAQRTRGIRARRSVRVCAKVRRLGRRRGPGRRGGSTSIVRRPLRRPAAPAARPAPSSAQPQQNALPSGPSAVHPPRRQPRISGHGLGRRQAAAGTQHAAADRGHADAPIGAAPSPHLHKVTAAASAPAAAAGPAHAARLRADRYHSRNPCRSWSWSRWRARTPTRWWRWPRRLPAWRRCTPMLTPWPLCSRCAADLFRCCRLRAITASSVAALQQPRGSARRAEGGLSSWPPLATTCGEACHPPAAPVQSHCCCPLSGAPSRQSHNCSRRHSCVPAATLCQPVGHVFATFCRRTTTP